MFIDTEDAPGTSYIKGRYQCLSQLLIFLHWRKGRSISILFIYLSEVCTNAVCIELQVDRCGSLFAVCTIREGLPAQREFHEFAFKALSLTSVGSIDVGLYCIKHYIDFGQPKG